jgi:hypothetical protein
MDHDEILSRLYARKRFDIGTEIRNDRLGGGIRRASQLDRPAFWQRLISRLPVTSLRFGERTSYPLRDGIADIDASETVATPS